MFDSLADRLQKIIQDTARQKELKQDNMKEALREIRRALLEADVNLRVVRRFVNATIEEAKGEKVLRAVDPGQQFVKIVYDRMVKMLGDTKVDLQLKGADTQSVILLLGLQGAGKTTAAHKLAARLVEQLKQLGEKINVPVYFEDGQKNAVKVAQNGLSYAKKNGLDTVIVDTAGRLQIDEEMMKELVDVKKAMNPVETVLVADSMTGQNAVDIAQSFDEQLGLTGVILTKFDSDARGGAALSLKTITGKPILFIGTGEKTEDFEPFHPERIASRILGMGDIVSLVEKAQETVDAEEAQKLERKMAKGNFTLNDMLEQFERVGKMGSISSLMEMIPGLAGQIDESKLDLSIMKRQKAIIQAMTMKERANHLIIGPSRRKRIAKGSGTSVAEVNKLIKQFEKTKLMMKKLTKNKGLQAQLMQHLGGMK